MDSLLCSLHWSTEMNNFTNIVSEKFLKAVNTYNMLDGTREVVVGFSGGADSVCLLYVLNSFKENFNYSLKAVHVNHGIRGDEARSDELFAENFCKDLDIPFFLVDVDCIAEAKKNKESVEECGRRLRYESFNRFCDVDSKIATAHNANDNAETLLFNMTRGCSVKGLCGIPFTRNNIIRPLLLCSRTEIEGYCKENGLQYVIDSTNLNTDYTRNKIRHKVLPVLQEINPSFLDSFSALSDNAENVLSYLSESTYSLKEQAQIKAFVYDRNLLLKSSKVLTMQLIASEFYELFGITLDNKKVKALYDLLETGGRLQLFGNLFAEVKKDYFRFYKFTAKSPEESVTVQNLPFKAVLGDFSIFLEEISDNSKFVNQLSNENMIDCNTLSGNLVLRTRKSGDSFTFPKRNVTKSLKKLFNEENIPIELRDKIPVICDGNGVVWVYGFGVTKRCCVTKTSVNIISVRGENNDR